MAWAVALFFAALAGVAAAEYVERPGVWRNGLEQEGAAEDVGLNLLASRVLTLIAKSQTAEVSKPKAAPATLVEAEIAGLSVLESETNSTNSALTKAEAGGTEDKVKEDTSKKAANKEDPKSEHRQGKHRQGAEHSPSMLDEGTRYYPRPEYYEGREYFSRAHDEGTEYHRSKYYKGSEPHFEGKRYYERTEYHAKGEYYRGQDRKIKGEYYERASDYFPGTYAEAKQYPPQGYYRGELRERQEYYPHRESEAYYSKAKGDPSKYYEGRCSESRYFEGQCEARVYYPEGPYYQGVRYQGRRP